MTNRAEYERDPRACWEERGRDYAPAGLLEGEFENIAFWVINLAPTEILEVGAGWGRIYSYLTERKLARNFGMCDFVESMRQGCLKCTGVLPDYWDGVTLPYEDDSYDMVLSYATLQHVPPNDIERVFAEHVRVARRFLYVGGWCLEADVTFCHDYVALFQQHGVEIVGTRRWRGKHGELKQYWMVKV